VFFTACLPVDDALIIEKLTRLKIYVLKLKAACFWKKWGQEEGTTQECVTLGVCCRLSTLDTQQRATLL
jgi:hypothetical protein